MLLDRADIQGLVVSGYAAEPASALLLVRFGIGKPHAWLRRLLPKVSSARRAERFERYRVNVAFSCRGLERLGLGEQTLSRFSPEFRQGMAHPQRSRVLGDIGEDAPEHWWFGNDAHPVDALVLVYAKNVEDRELKLQELTALLEQFELDYDEVDTYLDPEQREHFGFRFAVTSPLYKRGLSRRRGRRLPAGELLLGHEDLTGRRAESPAAPYRLSTRDTRVHSRGLVDLGHNGTYLVLRQLEQRVAVFWSALDALVRQTRGALGDAAALAAQLVGRSMDGDSVARCPAGAHSRRASASGLLGAEADAHRLLRRGRLYGARAVDPRVADGVGRGLMFVALNADLARQFEFVQQNLINDPKFGGLRAERDPLLGQDDALPRVFTAPGDPVRVTLGPLPRFVRVRGGGYFFLPSLRALGYLSEAHAL
jgi:deferrochelatase/peroxidase EfeB